MVDPGGHVEPGEYLTDALAARSWRKPPSRSRSATWLGSLELPGPDRLIILDYHATTSGDEAPVAGDDVDDVSWGASVRSRTWNAHPASRRRSAGGACCPANKRTERPACAGARPIRNGIGLLHDRSVAPTRLHDLDQQTESLELPPCRGDVHRTTSGTVTCL